MPRSRVPVLLLLSLLASSCGGTTPVAPTPIATTPSAPASPDPAPAGSSPDPAPTPASPEPPAPTPTPPGPVSPPIVPAAPVVFAGAGDIGVCGVEGAALTAELLDTLPGIVFTTGDNAYSSGTAQEYADCYDPFWGRHKARTRPTPGNHEYKTASAAPYFDYFGVNAGPWGLGYYSFNAGAWLVLSLNSNVPAGAGSAQLAWVRQQLTSQPSRCVAVFWHHPLFSSGPHGPNPQMRDVWRTLMEFKADLVIAGHDHIYERFAPLDENGVPSADGIRSFVAGSGGAPLYAFGVIQPGSEVRIPAWGILKLTLRSDSFDWEFMPVRGQAGSDHGSQVCR